MIPGNIVWLTVDTVPWPSVIVAQIGYGNSDMFDLVPLETKTWVQGVNGKLLKPFKPNQSVTVEPSATRDVTELKNMLQKAVATAKSLVRKGAVNEKLRQIHNQWMNHVCQPMPSLLPPNPTLLGSPSKLKDSKRFDYTSSTYGKALDVMLVNPNVYKMLMEISFNLAHAHYDNFPGKYYQDMNAMLDVARQVPGGPANMLMNQLTESFNQLAGHLIPFVKQESDVTPTTATSDEGTLAGTPTHAIVRHQMEVKKLPPGQHHTQLRPYDGPVLAQGDNEKGPFTGWICPVDGCKEMGIPCRIRPVEMRQTGDDTMARLYYTDGAQERVFDHDCGLVQHMLSHHKDRMASKQERAKRRRAEGVLWHCTCKNRINKNDGVVEVGHFLSAKHHHTRHYQCVMKHDGVNSCDMTFSDSELFRQHYVAVEGPVRAIRDDIISLTKPSRGGRTRSAAQNSNTKRKRRVSFSETESEASVEFEDDSDTSSFQEEDDKYVEESAKKKRQVATKRPPHVVQAPVMKPESKPMESVNMHQAEFDIDKTHRQPEWRQYVLTLQGRLRLMTMQIGQFTNEREAIQKQLDHYQQYFQTLPNFEQELSTVRMENAQLLRDNQLLRMSLDEAQKQLREAQAEVRRAYMSKLEEEPKLDIPQVSLPQTRGSSPHRLDFYPTQFTISPNIAYLSLPDHPVVEAGAESGAWDALH